MRHVFAVLATVSLVVAGCGAPAVEPEAAEHMSASQELATCPGSLPACESLQGSLCKPSGARQDCCEGSIALYCSCSSTYKWICP
jgi:hypothetical protein